MSFVQLRRRCSLGPLLSLLPFTCSRRLVARGCFRDCLGIVRVAMPVAALSPLHSAEGFTVDVLLRIQRATLLNPALAWLLPVLAGLNATATPPHTASSLVDALQHLPSTFPHILRTDRLSQLALAVFALAAGLQANSLLNRAARNNFARDRKGWDWASEIVVITGGARVFLPIEASFGAPVC